MYHKRTKKKKFPAYGTTIEQKPLESEPPKISIEKLGEIPWILGSKLPVDKSKWSLANELTLEAERKEQNVSWLHL